MRRVKVLQIITGLGPGGAERLVLDLTARLNPADFDVHLAALSPDTRALEIYGHTAQHVEIFDLRRGSRITEFCRLRRFITGLAPDVIHAHMFHALIAAIGSTAGSKLTPAICFTSHAGQYPWMRALITRALKGGRAADIILFEGQHSHMNAPKTEVIPNGVSLPETSPERTAWDPNRAVRIISVGRLEEPKDPLGLVRAFAAAELPRASLTFVGAGPLEEGARRLAGELGVGSQVTFLGLRSDVRTLLRSADIFALFSKSEGMPMALLEAGAEALPVISTPVGAVEAVLSEGCGCSAKPIDFAAHLRELALNPERALAMGSRLRGRISSSYSLESTAKAHEDLYRRIAPR